MKENGEATSTTAPSSSPPRTTTAPSTPAAGNKRKRNDDEGEGEVQDDLAEDSLADSPQSEEKKGTKRMKAPHPSSPSFKIARLNYTSFAFLSTAIDALPLAQEQIVLLFSCGAHTFLLFFGQLAVPVSRLLTPLDRHRCPRPKMPRQPARARRSPRGREVSRAKAPSSNSCKISFPPLCSLSLFLRFACACAVRVVRYLCVRVPCVLHTPLRVRAP